MELEIVLTIQGFSPAGGASQSLCLAPLWELSPEQSFISGPDDLVFLLVRVLFLFNGPHWHWKNIQTVPLVSKLLSVRLLIFTFVYVVRYMPCGSHHIRSEPPQSGSWRPRHAPLLLTGRRALVVLPRFKVLDGLSVLVIDQGHGDHCVPAALLTGAPEIDLLIVCGYDGEIDELAGALHTVHLLDGLKLQLFALRAFLGIRVNVEAVRGQDARLPLPELEQVVAPLLQLSLFQHLADLRR